MFKLKKNQGGIVTIVEGEFDALALEQWELKNVSAIAVAGTSGFTERLYSLIDYLKSLNATVLLCPDGDEAGIKVLPNFKSELMIELPEGVKDFGELFCKNAGDSEFNALEIFKSLRKDNIGKILKEREQIERKRKEWEIKDNIERLSGVLSADDINNILFAQGIKSKDENDEQIIKQAVNLRDADDIKPLDVFGVPIEFGSIGLIAGATGTGKTEFIMDIADNFSKKTDENICLLSFYEGSDKHIQQRLFLKGINNKNLFYSIKPDFSSIQKFVENNKDKKILIVVDYLQKAARVLRTADKKRNKTENNALSVYVDLIFEFYDNLRNKNDNVCIYLLSSFSKAGINDIRSDKLPDPITIGNSVKESGDIFYDVDYGYSLFFATEQEKNENKWNIGRKLNDIYRKYMLLYPIKDSRLNGALSNNIYVFNLESRRYDRIENTNNNYEKERHLKIKGRPRQTLMQGQL